MANGRTGLVIKPITSIVSSLQSLYQRPPETIRGIELDSWYSPLQPVQPFAPPGSGIEPRGFQMWAGQNLIWTPRADAEFSAADLKMLATYPLARVCIENVKDTVCRAPWEIQVRPKPGETRTERLSRSRDDKNISALNNFFEYPDREHNWQEWLRPLLDDMLVIDAASILIRKTFKGEIAELPVIRGEMIVRYVDANGFTPTPPSPAYAQNWWGLPLVDLTTDQLVYKPRTIVPRNTLASQLYGMCYSSDTEILTRDRGFILFSDLRLGDFVATRNADKEFEWQQPNAFINESYAGPMYSFTSRCMDLLVTPLHRMLITANRRRTEKIVTAEELAAGNHHERKIPATSVWCGAEVEPKMFVSNATERKVKRLIAAGQLEAACEVDLSPHYGNDKPVLMNGDQYCAFMGAYLAEGWTHETGVYISQLETSSGFRPYQQLFTGILGKKPKHTGKDFSIPRRGLRDYLKAFGHAHEKFIPQEILAAPIRQLKLFWDYFVLGDGSLSHRTSASMRGHQPRLRAEFTTVSKCLADGLVEISQKLGWSASVGLRKGGKLKRFADHESECRDSYHVRVRYSSHMSVNAERLEYSGTVHCVSVPNGIVYVRRNGKPAWCGNSPTEQLAPEIQVGVKRLQFVLAYYTEGSVPGVVQVVPRGTNIDRIEEAMEWMNSQLAGNLAKRNQWRLVQGFNEPGKPDQIVFSKEALLTGLYDEKHIREIAFGYGTSPQRLMKMIRTEGKSSSDAAEIQGTLPWVLWVKGLVDYIIQRKMGLTDYEIAIDPYAEPDPLKNAAALTMLVGKAILTPNEGRKRVGEELRPEPEADQLGVITGTGFIPIGVAPAQAGVMVDEKGKLKPHPVTPSLPASSGNGHKDPNATRGSTPVSQEAGGGRSTGRNVGVPSGKEDIGKKKIEKRLGSRIESHVLTAESQQAVHQIQSAIQKVFQSQYMRAETSASSLRKILSDILNKRQFGNVQFNLTIDDAQKVLAIPVDGADFAAKARDMNPHVTVLWGFHPEVTAEQINEITKGIGEIDIMLDGLETFPEGPDGIPLIIRFESEKLQKLHEDLKALPHSEIHPDYKPHIAIAYLKPGTDVQKYTDAGNPLEGEIFTLSNLLFSSVDYTVSELAKLAKGEKLTQQEVDYTPFASMMNEMCERCEYFEQIDGCAIVRGVIAATGWCKKFEPQFDLPGERIRRAEVS